MKLIGMKQNEALVVNVGDITFPVEIQEELEGPVTPDIAILCRGYPIEVFVSEDSQSQEQVQDAWQMRREFFQLDQNTQELLKFLNRWGEWSLQRTILPSVILRERDWLRESLLGKTRWFGSSFSMTFPRPMREYPHYLLEASDCRQALSTTVTLDLLRRVKSRLCARRDCGVPFAIESQHKRKFCCQYCAHLVSVRKQRREAKKTKGKR